MNEETKEQYQYVELAELVPDEISQTSSAGGLRDLQLVEHNVRQAEPAKLLDRLGRTTVSPLDASCRQISNPMPRFPPVTRATLTRRRKNKTDR